MNNSEDAFCRNSSGRSGEEALQDTLVTSNTTTTTSPMTNRMKSFLRTASGSVGAVSDGDHAVVETTGNNGPSTGAVSAIIAMQDWDKLRMLLSTDIGQQAVQREVLTSADYAAESVLSYACRFHPPLDVVRGIMSLLPPDVARQIDPMGRSALHIAAKWGAAPRVIRFLAEAHPVSAALQDNTGMTPLHHACESYASKYSSRKADGKPLKEAMLEVVRYLCKLSPTTVNLEDNEEFTALEYAIQNDLDIKVVRSLQKACEKDWKKRRAAGGTKQRHDDVRHSMLLQQQQSQRRIQEAEQMLQTRPTPASTQPQPPQEQQPMEEQEQQQSQPQTSRTRKRGSDLYIPPKRPQQEGVDIADVSKALSALGKSAQEGKNTDEPGKGKVPLNKPRKTASTRALMA